MATTTAKSENITQLIKGIQKVLIGKEEVVLRTVVTLVARGHLLIEDVPGIGKTLLGLALARSIDASFRRIQFTNDLLPADILGLNIYNRADQRFEFQRGPIFSHIILADEINRSTPKTQSALLEAMNEQQVSIDGTTYPLERPFMVIATENPVEYHGTFPLPEAQLDRFLMRVQIGYPAPESEKEILQSGDMESRLKDVSTSLTPKQIIALQNEVDNVQMEDSIADYIIQIAQNTRTNSHIKLGLSPRGSQALCRAAKAHALIGARDYVIPDDVKRMAVPVIAHRLVFDSSQHGLARVGECEALVEEILQKTPAPQ